MDAVATLNRLNAKVEEAQRNASLYEGRIAALKEQLATRFNVSSLEEATALYEQLSVQLAQLNNNIEKRVMRLQNAIEGGSNEPSI